MEAYDKIIYTIGDAAHIADVKPYVLRYWETEFEILRPEKSVTGQRCYRPRDMRIVLTLKRLLHREGFTIVGARKKISEMSESEWEPFPPSSSSESEKILPEGRSVEGTVDARERLESPHKETHASAEVMRHGVVDNKKADEFNRLWGESVRILNKYLNE
jgi:DNA-binding transcriptional MerR regulator